MTDTAIAVDNGVNVEALLGAREALTEMPAAAQFTWRAESEWKSGTHTESRVEKFFGLGEEQSQVRAGLEIAARDLAGALPEGFDVDAGAAPGAVALTPDSVSPALMMVTKPPPGSGKALAVDASLASLPGSRASITPSASRVSIARAVANSGSCTSPLIRV